PLIASDRARLRPYGRVSFDHSTEAWMRVGVACAVFLAAAVRLGAQDFKAYQNYDFVPGDQILFEDDFSSDTDGEFAAHWKLEAGQGAVNKMNGQTVLAMTDGNYFKVA